MAGIRTVGQQPAFALALAQLIAAAGLAAQDPTPPGGAPTAGSGNPGQRTSLERVVAVIGEHVVFESELKEELETREKARQHPFASPAERNRESFNILRDIYQQQAMIERGKTLGRGNVDTFREWVNKRADELVRTEELKAGSTTRLIDELELVGETTQGLESQMRDRIFQSLAYQDALGDRRRYSNLLVTPRRMRKYYDANPQLFSEAAKVDLESILVPADRGEDQAWSVAHAWREPGAKGADLAKAASLRHSQIPGMLRDGSGDRAAWMREFARDAEEGAIQVVPAGSFFWVLRLAKIHPAKSETFTDPAVQARIRRDLQNQAMAEAQQRALIRSSRGLLVWPPELRQAGR